MEGRKKRRKKHRMVLSKEEGTRRKERKRERQRQRQTEKAGRRGRMAGWLNVCHWKDQKVG